MSCSESPPTAPTSPPPGGQGGSTFPPAPQPPVPPTPGPPRSTADEVFVGAGDIGNCNLTGAKETGRLLDGISGTVFTLGDNAYSEGSAEEFAECYDPHWGRQRHRTAPTPGNHDYETPGASAYFSYFGGRAGGAGSGYYRFALGAWDIYSLNSQAPADEGSAQYAWLAAELAQNTSKCTLAYWHYPVRSSSKHGDQPHMMAIWRLLFQNGTDVILSARPRLRTICADEWGPGLRPQRHAIDRRRHRRRSSLRIQTRETAERSPPHDVGRAEAHPGGGTLQLGLHSGPRRGSDSGEDACH